MFTLLHSIVLNPLPFRDPHQKLSAATYKIVPTADRQKSTVKVKVRFDKVDARILPDMSAKITFIQKDPQAASHLNYL